MEDEENDSLCERILLDLDNIFKRDTEIAGFDIIDVVESVCNKSPVVYIDHHIGLEKWCVAPLYQYTTRKIVNYRKNCPRTDNHLVHQWTRLLLLLNPDFTTAWNLRRSLVNNSVQNIVSELKLAELVLIRKPKCASVYSYREWLLNLYYRLKNELNDDLISNELRVTIDAASHYHRNYHAWSHRTWIFTSYLANANLDALLERIINDLVTTEKWVETHISDYSCFQHRQCLYHYIFTIESKQATILYEQACADKVNTCKEYFLKEFDFIDSTFPLYTDRESLFLHRRFLLHAASLWCPSKLAWLKNREANFYHNHLVPLQCGAPAQSWQSELIKRYLTYLQRNLNWTFQS